VLRAGIAAQLAAHGVAVRVGQDDIEDDHLGRAVKRQPDRLRAGVRADDLVPGQLKIAAEQISGIDLVLNHQDSVHRSLPENLTCTCVSPRYNCRASWRTLCAKSEPGCEAMSGTPSVSAWTCAGSYGMVAASGRLIDSTTSSVEMP